MVFFSLLSLVSEKRDGGQLLTNHFPIDIHRNVITKIGEKIAIFFQLSAQ